MSEENLNEQLQRVCGQDEWPPLCDVESLIAQGADVNSANTDGCTCLHIALHSLNSDIMELLLDRGATVNKGYINQWTLLHFACYLQNGDSEDVLEQELKIVRLLLDRGADVNSTAKYNQTPLHIACKFDNKFRIIQLLVDRGADVNCKEMDIRPCLTTSIDTYPYMRVGWTPLQYACSAGYSDLALLLISRGADTLEGFRDITNSTVVAPLDEKLIQTFRHLLITEREMYLRTRVAHENSGGRN